MLKHRVILPFDFEEPAETCAAEVRGRFFLGFGNLRCTFHADSQYGQVDYLNLQGGCRYYSTNIGMEPWVDYGGFLVYSVRPLAPAIQLSNSIITILLEDLLCSKYSDTRSALPCLGSLVLLVWGCLWLARDCPLSAAGSLTLGQNSSRTEQLSLVRV